MKLMLMMTLITISNFSWAGCDNITKNDSSISFEVISEGNHSRYVRTYYIHTRCNPKDARVVDEVDVTLLEVSDVTVITVDNVQKVFLNEVWADFANKDQDCNFKDWKVNVKKEVSGLECSTSKWLVGETYTVENE